MNYCIFFGSAVEISNSFLLIFSDIESRRVVIKHLDNINHYAFGIWGTTFLHWLVEKNLTNIVREAADISQKIDKLNNSLETPLHLAAKQGNLQMVTHLLYNGANVNAVDFCGNTPLHVAVTMVGENHSKIIQMILRFRPEIDKRNQESLTPLMVLCKNLEIAEQVESVFLLMISGASVLIGHTTYTIDDRAVTAIDYAYAQVLKYYFEKNETSMKISTKAMHFLCLKIFIELSGTSEDCRRSDYDGFFERDVPFYKKVDLPIYIKKAIENSKKVKLGSKTLWHIAFFSIEKISVFFSDFSMKKAAETCVVRTGSRLLDIWLKKKISIATKRCNYVYACLSREVYLQLQFMEKVFQNWNEDSQWYVFICNTRKYTIPNECYICAL